MRLNAVRVFSIPLICILAALTPVSIAQAGIVPASRSDRAEARDIFKQLIEINTTDTAEGNVTTGSAAMEKRFLDAGFAKTSTWSAPTCASKTLS
jgi:hypothetical protein